jgi:4-oxalomesaconate tautomerase
VTPDRPLEPADAGIPCLLMRGGTSKGAYFLAADLPADPEQRDDLLLRVMGSPDPRQIDGLGGAHPLTSKVAVISPSASAEADVDYLFLQVAVGEATVSDRQNCGNLLAGVGPFAVERGLVKATDGRTEVRIRMVNTGGLATATFSTPDGRVRYAGDTEISGVATPAAAITLDFSGTEGSSCGALLPTGSVRDELDGLEVTCLDNGMPVVLLRAGDLGITGYETPSELEADETLRERLERVRLAAGPVMGLGPVEATTVPKLSLLAAPRHGGRLSTRTFIPHRCHSSIGVLGAVSVATAVGLPGSIAAELAGLDPTPGSSSTIRLEHPTGFFDVQVELELSGDTPRVVRSGVIRTARKLFDGVTWPWTPF